MLETSVLERLSGPLCDAVTGRGGGQGLLERVERANLFLVPLDEARGWWRYHELFADLLQARLRRQQPDRVPGLHQVAAARCERQGLADDAIRHALAAGADEPFEPSVGRELSVLANIPATIVFLRSEVARQRGDPERAAELIRLGLSRLTDADQALRTLAPWGLAMAAMMQGRLQEAERALAKVVTDPHLTSVRPWYDLGRIQQILGRPDAALATFAQLVEAASEAGRPLPLAGVGHVGLAMAHRERHELDAALDHGTQAVALCRQLPYAQTRRATLREPEQLVLARVLTAGGQAAKALGCWSGCTPWRPPRGG